MSCSNLFLLKMLWVAKPRRQRDWCELIKVGVGNDQNDVLGAYERDCLGNWVYTCEPGGERQRELAIRFGINLIMYATCLIIKPTKFTAFFLKAASVTATRSFAAIPEGI